jgi:diguanylate cyclase (GGDEF)-like protein/PAS domain S-box-containing protein
MTTERKLRLLMVDDVQERSGDLRERLLEGTWQAYPDLEFASSQEQAFELLDRHKYGLLLLDAKWNGRKGVHFLTEMRKRKVEVPVIVIGDPGDEKDGLEVLKAGARDYLDRSTMTGGSLNSAIRFAVKLHREELLHRQAEEALKRSEVDYRNLFEGVTDAVLIFEPETEMILEANRKACETYDLSRKEIIGLSLKNFSPDPGRGREEVRRMMKTREPCRFETVHFGKDGRTIDMMVTASVVEYQGKTAVLSVNRDITENKLAAMQIEKLAYQDALTGLPNRLRFDDRLNMALTHARREAYPLAVLYLDLDRFKVVNDSLGHKGGDILLRQVAARLTELIRGSDTLARLGGDEFILLLYKIAHAEDAGIVARKLLDLFRSPFDIEGRELYVTASVGICVFPQDGADGETLIKNADIAMYRAKQHGRNGYQFYLWAMEESGLERLTLETEMHRALEAGQFRVFYQPKVTLKTGEVLGMEALVRWQHPTRGLVPPVEFIGLAEETGLIVPLGSLVMREACQQTKMWHDAGWKDLVISVNLSAAQFQQQDLSQVIAGILKETGLEPRFLELEITESIAMRHVESTNRILAELTALGLNIAMDDFGTGYSSLSYLKRFPISTIKIDKSFVQDLMTNPNDASIARATIVMSHELKMKVVAEGVETKEQKNFLERHDCDEMQGYLFSGPLQAGEFEQLLGRVAVRKGPESQIQ